MISEKIFRYIYHTLNDDYGVNHNLYSLLKEIIHENNDNNLDNLSSLIEGAEGRIYLNEGCLIKIDWGSPEPQLPQYYHIGYGNPIFDDNDIDMIMSLSKLDAKNKLDQKIRKILHLKFPSCEVKNWDFV
ncbi:MAG: hypothetical protein KatS3mg002_0434 [Candidatus Woesearchaeota archaeon]|nr:MAG: hypothetical protein KatS3mg002_0434 [Candidatus Woesearchaeota archaeon]